jgi:hypothetical protein
MIRILLTYVLPLVLPTAVYVAWIAYARSQHQGTPEELPALEKGPLFWCVLLGFALMALALMAIALTTGAPPGSQYQPPRLEGGQVVPPEYKEKK